MTKFSLLYKPTREYWLIQNVTRQGTAGWFILYEDYSDHDNQKPKIVIQLDLSFTFEQAKQVLRLVQIIDPLFQAVED